MRLLPLPRAPALALAGLLACPSVHAARAETDRDSPAKFLSEEHTRASQGVQAPRDAPYRASSAFRHAWSRRPIFEPHVVTEVRAVPDRHAPRSVVVAPRPAETSVAVYGDRFGQALAAGLGDDADDRLAVVPQTSDDAGLTRADFDSWLQALRTRLAKPDRPGLAIVMLGSNDRQPLTQDGTTLDLSDPRWPALYGARVDALAAAFREAHVPLIWVGLPSVHSEDISADFVRLNGIVRDRLAQHGATYVDSWEAFNDENGRYSPVGPDIEGLSVKLRKAEGFGFTRAGARKLASFVEGDVKRLLVPPGGRVADITIETTREFDQVLQIDVNAQIRREAGLPPEGALPTPGAGGPASPPKPSAGPVISLTAPPLSPNGQLAGSGIRASLDLPAPDADRAAAPKPGRADDFAWPKTP